ncbi:MAG: hypothetical protein IMZ61_10430 [Planctomycetes bacterium]|nr:hypothetical protein [Planctomycetota bacterium]
MRKKIYVVDTNVPLVANGASGLSPNCVSSCTNILEEIMANKGCVAIDDKWLLIKEYTNKLRSQGQRGVGDTFLKWILTNQRNKRRCEITCITPQSDSFVEFPRHASLDNFDKSDRKFVAVAAAHPNRPPILQAADSKWWGWKKALKKQQIDVIFLCLADVQAISARRNRRRQSREAGQ